MTFGQAVRELYEGDITFEEFVRATRERWEKLASYIMRRWRLPAWASLEDIVQELLLGAWNCVWKFAPVSKSDHTPGAHERYVVWNAVDYAKKKAHKVRGASRHRGADANPSAPEVTFSQLGTTDGWAENVLGAVAPQQEELFAQAERVDRALRVCRTKRERLVVQALAQTESLQGATKQLYADVGARIDCRFGCEHQAALEVVKVAAGVARRLAE